MAQQDPELKWNQLYAWDQWVVWTLGRRPWPASFLIAGILLASYWAFAFVFDIHAASAVITSVAGVDPDFGTSGLPFGIGAYDWAGFVFSLLGGYAGTVASYNLVAQRNESAEAAQMLGVDEETLVSRWDSHFRACQPTARLVSVLGYVLGVIGLVPVLPGVLELFGVKGAYTYLPPASLQFVALWFFLIGPPIFSLIAKAVYLALSENRFWSEFRHEVAAPDIFDVTKLRPVTKAAMRGSFTWIIGATIGSLFFVSNDIDRSVLLPFFIGIGFIAVMNLILPLVGWHRVILAEKERQLKDVRDVIDRTWTRLRAAEDDDAVLAKMGGLLSMEARIQAAREWPIDFSTIGRLAFYLAIPLVSWIGGALMERVVDAAIG